MQKLYIKVTVPYKYKTVIEILSQNKNIALLNQDTRQEVVILYRTKHVKKMYERNQHISIQGDRARSYETSRKNQKTDSVAQKIIVFE